MLKSYVGFFFLKHDCHFFFLEQLKGEVRNWPIFSRLSEKNRTSSKRTTWPSLLYYRLSPYELLFRKIYGIKRIFLFSLPFRFQTNNFRSIPLLHLNILYSCLYFFSPKIPARFLLIKKWTYLGRIVTSDYVWYICAEKAPSRKKNLCIFVVKASVTFVVFLAVCRCLYFILFLCMYGFVPGGLLASKNVDERKW